MKILIIAVAIGLGVASIAALALAGSSERAVPDVQTNLQDADPGITEEVRQDADDPGTDVDPGITEPHPITGRTVYYSVEDVPDVPDSGVLLPALEKSMRMWEEANPGLKYVKSDRPDIEFVWHTGADNYWQGYATCEDWYGPSIDCVVEIVAGDHSCNGTYYTKPENVLVNLMMHEIGHTFGLDHTADESHLMYDERNQTDPYDERGISIPDRIRDVYDVANEKSEMFDAEFAMLDARLAVLDEEYDRITGLEAERDELDETYNQRLAAGDRDAELYNRLVAMDEKINREWGMYSPRSDAYNGDVAEYDARLEIHNAGWERLNAWTEDKCFHVESLE